MKYQRETKNQEPHNKERIFKGSFREEREGEAIEKKCVFPILKEEIQEVKEGIKRQGEGIRRQGEAIQVIRRQGEAIQ
jgi:hypothetical protein